MRQDGIGFRTLLAGWVLGFSVASTSQDVALAVPAAPLVHTLGHADGATIRARLQGDEWSHWYETADGRPLVRSRATGYWEVGVRPTSCPRRPLARTAAHERPVGATGTGYIPVIMVTFSDRVPVYGRAEFDNLLFGAGNSMRNYFSEVSCGKFTVSAGPGGIVGWYTASREHDYYGGGAAGDDPHAAGLVVEAVKAADAAGFDFAPYDRDGDGKVDVVCIIHQGEGEEASGDPSDIWCHGWDLDTAAYFGDGPGPVRTNDGVTVNKYMMVPEVFSGGIQTVGAFCHEYGHALGLPDLYDIDDSSSGLGTWSVMATGIWNGTSRLGDCPAHMDAWCKQKLGWVHPVVPPDNVMAAAIPQAETNSFAYRLWARGGPAAEYFLIENRQQVGFDACLPGSGLLVYHVDEWEVTNGAEWYPGHTTSGHYMIALEQADGSFDLERNANRGDGGDPYIGSGHGLEPGSTPSSRPYSGLDMGIAVRNVSNSGPTMTADIIVRSAPATFARDFGSGVWLIGIPAYPTHPSADAVLGTPVVVRWNAQTQTYQQFSDGAFELAPGMGVWVKLPADRRLSFEGSAPSEAVTRSLFRGWNLLANPFPSDLTWANVAITRDAQAFAWTQNASGTGYELVCNLASVGTSREISPWQGFWLKADEDCQITFGAPVSPSTVARDTVTKWHLRLCATTGAAADEHNYVGVAKGSPIMADNPPPHGGEYVDLYCLQADGKRKAVSLVSSASKTEWNLVAETNLPNTRVDIAFPNLSTVPAHLSLALRDLDADRTVNMRTSQGYSFTSGPNGARRHLRIEAEPRVRAASPLALVAAHPAINGVQIVYSLSTGAEVNVDVLNIAGRAIARVPCGHRNAGTHTAVWTRLSMKGTRAPSGRYLLSVRCRTEDGAQATRIISTHIR